ncbi:MAG: AAA family ATPase, partial [Chloroflexi bacterium]|nr:AAA family ATPase [Chloroflexota bacterium]
MANQTQLYQQHNIEEYFIDKEPFYLEVADEIDIFEAAYAQRVPILLKGQTGSCKTRFVEYM